jgi:hypothetical protein
MEGEILNIETWWDEYHQESYKLIIEFKKKPLFHLGKVEVKQ